MINAIVYNSKTGSCERYARELSRALHIPCYSLDKAPVRSDAQVILVSWVMAGMVMGYKKAAKKLNVAAVVAVGMAPASEKSAAAIREKSQLPADVAVFSKQGAFHLNKLPAPMKLIMKLKVKDIQKQLDAKKAGAPLNAQEEALYKMAVTSEGEPASWDVSDIVTWAKSAYHMDGALHQ